MSQSAAESLVACLLEMAEAETNPVLQVIPEGFILEENKKYPTSLIQFNDLGWRAYYHCHPASRAGHHRFQGEHGHFHIFVRTKEKPDSEQWSHLVALAMDNMGQPLGWFTVNHWVTGETWETASVLSSYLDSVPFEGTENLLERWLLSLLALSSDSVNYVLNERDRVLEIKEEQAGEKDIKQDKNIYLLSETPLNLKELINLNYS